MTEFKGTKGIWTLEERFDKHYDQSCIDINVSQHIQGMATVWSGGNVLNDEIKATALLISKAPEMFELLKEIVTEFSVYKNVHGTSKCDLIFKAEDLIENATKI